MEWTREKTLTLINEYKQRRGLWDMTHDDYRKKEVKQKLLAEVGEILGGNIPTTEVEKKFHTLRTQYHREINRMKRKEPYNSKWFGFKNLQFLSSPKACRINKGRIRSEITEDGTVTTKIETSMGATDCSDGSPNSSSINEEFLTITKGSYENVISTSSNNSRTQEYEKLIEETTKDDEEEHIDLKPKLYSKIAVPLNQQSYSAHIQVNTDMDVGQPQIQQDASEPMEEEGMHAVEINSDSDNNIIYHTEVDHSGVNVLHNGQGTTTIQPSRIIKIQRREQYQDDNYYGDNQHQTITTSSTPKRIFYSTDAHTTSVVVNPTTSATFSQSSSSTPNYNITAITKLNPQQHRTATIKRLDNINAPTIAKQQQHQPLQSRDQQPRDQFSTYGEHIANEMRGITNREILIALKHKINTALFEAQMEDFQK